MKIFTMFLMVWSVMFASGAAWAESNTLTLSGEAGSIEVSMEALDSLPQESFRTTTIWTEGEVEFSGVPLSVLLNENGISGEFLTMVALNDYAVQMPFDEIGETFPIIATRMNGSEMSVRDKGPYWVVYPYDTDPEFQTETTFARSIWQLKALSVMD